MCYTDTIKKPLLFWQMAGQRLPIVRKFHHVALSFADGRKEYEAMFKLQLDEMTALGGQGPHSVIDVTDAFDWDGKNRGPRIGSYYTVLRGIDLEKVRVLVRDSAPIVEQAAVLQRVPTLQFVKVSFDHLRASVYADDKKNLHITAEAAAVKLFNPPKQQG